MAKIKHTKTELKAQTDALSRFQRFLPMLLLKKQQLQAEIAAIALNIGNLEKQQDTIHNAMQNWIAVFSDPGFDPLPMIQLDTVKTDTGNIAGVEIPVFVDAVIERRKADLFESPPWIDEALDQCEKIIRLREESAILKKQIECIAEELRVTTQRVNLFEKVKIPECKENIRIIKIHLGDEQTAAVVRGKLAKGLTRKRREKEKAA